MLSPRGARIPGRLLLDPQDERDGGCAGVVLVVLGGLRAGFADADDVDCREHSQGDGGGANYCCSGCDHLRAVLSVSVVQHHGGREHQ